jgi:predicted metalloprotease
VTVGLLIASLLAVAIVIWIGVSAQSKRIVRRRAAELSRATGIPAEQVEHEIHHLKITPGQWASLHGLDPMTFRPR